uniref:Chromatin modification-related protein EAF7-like n=1 Tax=Hirondellea gigas TaxID=1518452 RepID=A0A2P2I3X7_9CRUS
MTIEWTVNNEIQLFHAMTGHKPIGINKHFHMLMIHSKLSESLNRELYSRTIWDKLETLYDLAALDDNDRQALPKGDIAEFSLPSDYLPSIGSEDINTSTNIVTSTPVSALTPSSATLCNTSSAITLTTSSTHSSNTTTPISNSTSATRSVSSSSGHPTRHSSPHPGKHSSGNINGCATPTRATTSSDQLTTPKPRTYSRIANEHREGVATSPSINRRSGSNRTSNMDESSSNEATPRRLKRGRDSNSSSPAPSTPAHSKRRKT